MPGWRFLLPLRARGGGGQRPDCTPLTFLSAENVQPSLPPPRALLCTPSWRGAGTGEFPQEHWGTLYLPPSDGLLFNNSCFSLGREGQVPPS